MITLEKKDKGIAVYYSRKDIYS